MPIFTVRMVLHEASYGDYSNLTAELGKLGFSDVISHDDGLKYRLPDGEYTGQASDKASAIAAVGGAAGALGKACSILLTQADSHAWVGLKQT